MKGWKDVFTFTFTQNVKGKTFKAALYGIAALIFIIFLAINIIVAVVNDDDDKKIINLFGPMEKSKPNVNNIARTAFDLTIEMAEKDLGLTVRYRTYTAENYQGKTYDEVAWNETSYLDRKITSRDTI